MMGNNIIHDVQGLERPLLYHDVFPTYFADSEFLLATKVWFNGPFRRLFQCGSYFSSLPLLSFSLFAFFEIALEIACATETFLEYRHSHVLLITKKIAKMEVPYFGT